MPLDDLVSSLSLRHRVEEARIAINIAHSEQRLSKIALVSSFGAEAAVLLHLVVTTQPDMPVLFLDTGKHFTETLSYQKELSRDLGLRDLRAYAQSHSLPPHPLLAVGYLSIGCAPCTNRTDDTDDPRAGRWAGQDKSECGIHVPSVLNTTESTLS